MSSFQFIDDLSSELEQIKMSVNTQNTNLEYILGKSANLMLQKDNHLKSKSTVNKQNCVKYSFNREIVKNLITIIENYPKITAISSTPSSTKEFQNYMSNIYNKTEKLKNNFRRLQALKETVKEIKNALEDMNETEQHLDCSDPDIIDSSISTTD